MLRVACLLSALAACAHTGPALDLRTTAERSGYLQTGPHAETVRLCHDYAASYEHVRCDVIGTTLEGRELVALAIDRHPNLPVIAIEAGIHAGEIEGKDAGFAFIRDLLEGRVAPGALDHVAVVFVPTINPDGADHRGPNHRPNQRGPEMMGVRTQGARLNENRDFMKLDTPEIRAIVGVLRDRDPVLFIDLHTTDGAKFQTDLALNIAPLAPRDDELEETAHALETALITRLTALGHLSVPFYPDFDDATNPLSGFSRYDTPPRFAHFYAAARDRMGLLVETHSWRTYKERAQSTYHALEGVFEQATLHAEEWRRVETAATHTLARLAGTDVAIKWKPTTAAREIDFRGYAYEARHSDVSGGTWLVYDETQPRIWRVPLHEQLEPDLTVHVPKGGYVIEGGFAALVQPVLDAHGIRYRTLAEGTRLAVDAFRATSVTFAATPYEARQRPTLVGAWAPESRTVDRGAIFLPIEQPLARLVVDLCDPQYVDSFTAWGTFNAVFEQKENIDLYVLEEAARAQLAADPTLRAQYEAASAGETDPEQRMTFFWQRTPWWDERMNLVPVYRVDAVP